MTESSRRSFYAVLQEAKITPRQMKICEMKFVDGKMNYQIAMELNISTKTVDREISMRIRLLIECFLNEVIPIKRSVKAFLNGDYFFCSFFAV